MRELYTVRLERKTMLSAAAQCYHFEFAFTSSPAPALEAGQFLSLLADDSARKTYTRAYSIASAPRGGDFDLCVNRVEGGFFSNLLCDLEEGATLQCHGPHGLFTLRQPVADGLMIAAGTGIAPMRGFVQWLFPQDGPSRAGGHSYWLVYEAPTPEELFYDQEFRQVSGAHADFHYLPVIGGGGVPFAEAVNLAAKELAGRRAGLGHEADGPEAWSAYVCGLNETVKAARALLAGLGWQKRQVLFERYD